MLTLHGDSSSQYSAAHLATLFEASLVSQILRKASCIPRFELGRNTAIWMRAADDQDRWMNVSSASSRNPVAIQANNGLLDMYQPHDIRPLTERERQTK